MTSIDSLWLGVHEVCNYLNFIQSMSSDPAVIQLHQLSSKRISTVDREEQRSWWANLHLRPHAAKKKYMNHFYAATDSAFSCRRKINHSFPRLSEIIQASQPCWVLVKAVCMYWKSKVKTENSYSIDQSVVVVVVFFSKFQNKKTITMSRSSKMKGISVADWISMCSSVRKTLFRCRGLDAGFQQHLSRFPSNFEFRLHFKSSKALYKQWSKKRQIAVIYLHKSPFLSNSKTKHAHSLTSWLQWVHLLWRK